MTFLAVWKHLAEDGHLSPAVSAELDKDPLHSLPVHVGVESHATSENLLVSGPAQVAVFPKGEGANKTPGLRDDPVKDRDLCTSFRLVQFF